MKHLLDVNLLLAGIVATHPKNRQATGWLEGKALAICPIAEIGFLRIGSNPRAIGLTMTEARQALERFMKDRKVERIADDLPGLDSHPAKWDAVTDHYLADLAAKHGMKLATLDANMKHASVELVN